MQTTTYVFGTGDVIFTSAGNAPLTVGTLQDIEIDISSATETLYGQNQFPEIIARGEGKIEGKAKTGKIDLGLIASLYNGSALDTTGYEKLFKAEPHTIPANAPVTVQVTNSAAFLSDQGVFYSDGSGQLTPVTAGSEAAGKYSVNVANGTYTFSAADEGRAILTSYTAKAVTGSQLLITNQPMGFNPVFGMFLQEGVSTASGRTNLTMRLYSCVFSKMTFPSKNNVFMVSEFDFDAFTDNLNRVIEMGVGT